MEPQRQTATYSLTKKNRPLLRIVLLQEMGIEPTTFAEVPRFDGCCKGDIITTRLLLLDGD